VSLEKFREDYDCAPLDLEEFAYGAVDVEDSPCLVEAANQFLKAKQAFESALDGVDVELG
jgi:hypothetical protein